MNLFQNISCLRLIKEAIRKWYPDYRFQNISCLRLILKRHKAVKNVYIFQNISCLRLIYIFLFKKTF